MAARSLPVAILCVLAGVGALYAQERRWYVDCTDGDDKAAGTSPDSAWKSLRAASTHAFVPGDSILFRRGSVCRGLLAPKGSGSEKAPIRIGAYGSGQLPHIVAEPGQAAAFQLFDQQYFDIQDLEFSGGDPHGVFVSGSTGTLRGIHFRDIVVHGVSGEPKTKEGGLLVIAPGSDHQRFEDVLIDGVTAYGTSQWAGILVGGVNHGILPESARSSNVIVRNSIVHGVAGDGIVLFQVNQGLIENCIAWLTGMQATQTIGTPSGIWTWMCRDCTVRRNEAFLTDSPGVDGGAFDIDYGGDNTLLEENYGHDTQGYCIAIFGESRNSTNSVVRNNTCADNGRSPRLAIRQGAIFLSTWNRGKLQGVEISSNRILWRPPVATAALVNEAEFIGTGSFEKNLIRSASPEVYRSNPALALKENTVEQYGTGKFTSRTVSPIILPNFSLPDESGKPQPAFTAGRWTLLALVSAGQTESRGAAQAESRSQVALIESLHRQFPQLKIEIVVAAAVDRETRENLRHNWNAGDIPVLFDGADTARALHVEKFPSVVLLNQQGRLFWRFDGLTPPAELGLAIRDLVTSPNYSEIAQEK